MVRAPYVGVSEPAVANRASLTGPFGPFLAAAFEVESGAAADADPIGPAMAASASTPRHHNARVTTRVAHTCSRCVRLLGPTAEAREGEGSAGSPPHVCCP